LLLLYKRGLALKNTVKKMTPKQERFCQEYLVDLNATQAAIRAGYSAKTASRIGPQLLVKTCILNRLKSLQTAESAKLNIKREDILKEFWSVAKCEVDGYLVKTSDKLKALELTAKMLGLNEAEKLDIKNDVNITPYQINIIEALNCDET